MLEIYFILGPQDGRGDRIASLFGTLLWKYGPGFHNLPSFLQLLLVSSFLKAFPQSFGRIKSSFLFTVIFSPSLFVDLGPVIFFIFLVFFCFFSFLDLPGYAFYDFFSIIWGAGVCFFGVFKSTL